MAILLESDAERKKGKTKEKTVEIFPQIPSKFLEILEIFATGCCGSCLELRADGFTQHKINASKFLGIVEGDGDVSRNVRNIWLIFLQMPRKRQRGKDSVWHKRVNGNEMSTHSEILTKFDKASRGI